MLFSKQQNEKNADLDLTRDNPHDAFRENLTGKEKNQQIGQVRRRHHSRTIAKSARGTSLRNAHADGARSRVRERPAYLDEVLPLSRLWNATSLYVASRRGRRRRGQSGGGGGDGGGGSRRRRRRGRRS